MRLLFDDTTLVSSNSQHTGASATVELTFSDLAPGFFGIAISVTNTTDVTSFGAGATEAQLTGFGFDLLAGDLFSSATTSSSTLDTFIQDAAFQPSPTLDVAFADNTNFLGGNANDALSEGDTATGLNLIISSLFGNAADAEAAYLSAFSAGTLQAGLRFQQVNAGAGSDKLDFTGIPPVTTVPLPAGGLLLLAALGGLTLRRKS